VRNGLADHWAEILGLRVMQVNEAEGVGCVPKRQPAENRQVRELSLSGEH